MAGLKELLLDSKTTLKQVTDYLSKLSHDQKCSEVLTLNKQCQARLWELAKDGRPLDLDYLVPKAIKPLDPQPFDGKNSLPVYTRFQKVFYRTPDGQIAGYNNSSAAWLIGWGYYITEPGWKNKKELAVNYMKIPKDKPADWPEIKSNLSGLTRFVYGNMVDFLRGVDDDVMIGKATRKGEKEMESYFVLCRHKPLK
jgi:hypothetical protein